MADHFEVGKGKISQANTLMEAKNYSKAISLIKEAMNDFDSAIKEAKYNNKTNFVRIYESEKNDADQLLKRIRANQFKIGDDNKTVPIIKQKREEPIEQKPTRKSFVEERDLIKEAEEEFFDEVPRKEPVRQQISRPAIINHCIEFPEFYKDISVKLGRDDSGKVVCWKPQLSANQHLAAVGMSGTGKTTVLRTIMHQLEQQNVPLIIFDLHGDFAGQRVINFSDITINPLELDGLTPKEKAIEFAYICKRIFKLGDQQENKLREAIVYCYERKGIIQVDKSTYELPPPTLSDVNELLEETRDGKTIDTLLGRVKFFHRVELFMSETRCPFNEMFKGSTVIKLIEFSDNPDLQTALCEIFLNKLLFTVKKAGQSKLRLYCVLDEAHNLDDGKDSFRSPLVKIAREARKYGLGLILASQMPKDFSKSVLHNVATIITLKFNAREEAKAISEHMFGLNDIDILNLGEFGEGFIKFGNEMKKVKFFQKEELSNH